MHLGSLAYIGNAAVFDFGNKSFMGGLAGVLHRIILVCLCRSRSFAYSYVCVESGLLE